MTEFVDEFDPTANFTTSPNHWCRDPRLTLKAKGLLVYIKGHAPGYRLTVDQMIAESKDGRDAVYAALKELVEYEYLRRIQVRDRGKVVQVTYKWGPAATQQQYERAWKSKETAGETTSGKSGSGGEPDVSAGETTSGFSGSGFSSSGKTGSGNPDTKKTKRKNPITKKTNNENPPPSQRSPLPAEHIPAQEQGGDEISPIPDPGPGTESPPDPKPEPTLDSVADWFAGRRPDWRPADIRSALDAAIAQGLGDLTTCARALRELAEDVGSKHGHTKSPWRLVANCDRPWFAAAPTTGARPGAEPVEGPRCPEVGHSDNPQDGCAKCGVIARAESLGGGGASVDPGERQAVREAVRARGLRGRAMEAALARS